MLLTIGHSTRSMEEFVERSANAGVEIPVDVRAQPHSKRHPHFNKDALRATLEDVGITCHWSGRVLCGLRTPRADSPHIALDDCLRGFADHRETDEFKSATRYYSVEFQLHTPSIAPPSEPMN